MIIVDTGFLYAILDANDEYHTKVLSCLDQIEHEVLLLPTPAIVEIAYLIGENVGRKQMNDFIRILIPGNGPYVLEALQPTDIGRIHEILEKYSDSNLDFVDAVI